MLATFRETIRSLRDLDFGREVVKKTLPQAVWYWSKYLIGVAGLTFILGLFMLTYFVPQVPRLAQKNLPDIQLDVKNGKLNTNLTETFVHVNNGFAFIVSPTGSEQELDKYQSGILILADKVVTKSPEQTRQIKLSEIGDVSYDKSDLVEWARDHQLALLSLGISSLLLLSIVLWGFYWLARWPGWLLAGLVVWLIGRMWKKPIKYTDSLKIVIYAAVFPLLISVVVLFTATPVITILSMGVWLFYSLSWVNRLPLSKK